MWLQPQLRGQPANITHHITPQRDQVSTYARLVMFDDVYQGWGNSFIYHLLCPKYCVKTTTVDLEDTLFVTMEFHWNIMAKELILQNMK